MSLATRCPACGTVFRVVRDQLKVSEGWVRCGRCSEVFNAAQRLFELEQDRAPAAAAQDRPAAEVHRLPVRDDGSTAPIETPAEPPQPHAEITSGAHGAAPPEALAEAALPLPAEAPVASQSDAAPRAEPEAAPEAATETASPAPTPEFIRRADRAARWRHPARRGTLAAVALLLVALLAGQIALHFRDQLAAHWPPTRPGLSAVCQLLGCRVEAPRHIDSLNVESSGLVRMQDSPLYRLSLVLQNKAQTPVRMPAIDLALTDTRGQTMARRVLTAAELGNPAESLPAGGEVTLQATLDLGEQRVAGYTVELFYP